jgi:hypothetical protein
MKEPVKVGDLVETCSLMPGVVMTVDGDDIGVRMLHHTNEETPFPSHSTRGEMIFSQCSLSHCGIVKLTPQQVINRLVLGREGLEKIWGEVTDVSDYYSIVDKK